MSNDGKDPEILVSIPDCVATHVLGETSADLGHGDLTLVLTKTTNVSAPASPSVGGTSRRPVFTLSVGNAAFPLFKSTTFGTINDDERVYVFTPEIGGEVAGYVKITLPEGVTTRGSPSEKLQTQLEQILVHHGLLKEGVEAVADELAKSMREGSATVAQSVRLSTSDYTTEYQPTDHPVPIPGAVHSAASASASGTGGLVSAVGSMTGIVSSAAGQAGAWLASHVVVQATPPATRALTSAANAWDTVADGYTAGSTEVTAAVSDAAGARVERALGTDARAVAEDTGASVRNVGEAVGDVLVTASGPGLAMAGLKGAANTQLSEDEEKDAKAGQAQEERTLAEGEDIDGKLEDVSF